MKPFQFKLIIPLLLFGLIFPAVSISGSTADFITKEALKQIINQDHVTVIDVRRGKHYDSSDSKIKGAMRIKSGDIIAETQTISKKNTIILYCA